LVITPPTITPLLVAELLVEGERWPVYVHVIDHPDARVLVDTGMTELHPEVADLDPRLVPLSEQAFDLEGQLRVRALEPELVWLAHEHEPWRPRAM
jgi:glyoxylase-like metal-dependent hydrolase (beta-lactamase superfamily II)